MVGITFIGVTVDGHKSKSSSVRKYDKHHAGVVPEKKCKTAFQRL